MISGIDVHDKQGAVNWTKVAAAGHGFAFVRGAYGTKADARARENFEGARKAGLLCGLYHFYRMNPAFSFDAQIGTVVKVLKDVGYGRGDLPPVLDIEDNPQFDGTWKKTNNRAYLKGLKSWVQQVGETFGCAPIIYTRAGFWNVLGETAAFSGSPLWVADYTTAAEPHLPKGWRTYAFWQHNDRAAIDGVSGAGDANRFNGSAADLAALRQT